MLNRPAEIVASGLDDGRGEAIVKRRALAVPVGEQAQEMSAAAAAVRQPPVALIAGMMAMKGGAVVEQEIGEHERRATTAEARYVGRVRQPVG